MQTMAGIRELRARFSSYLRRVKAGETIVITEHGKPVGRIVPYTQSIDERLEALESAGLIEWSGEKLAPSQPAAKARGEKTVADLLTENR